MALVRTLPTSCAIGLRRRRRPMGATLQAISCARAHAAQNCGGKAQRYSGQGGPVIMSASIHSRRRTSMNDARRKEIQRALTLIGEAKGILELALDDLDNMPEDLQGNEEGQIAEDVVDALERAAMGCGDAITACKEAMQVSTSIA